MPVIWSERGPKGEFEGGGDQGTGEMGREEGKKKERGKE